ncbi:flagellar basal body-associated FliL family protein [Clostridium sp. JN-9]|uniref:flagellar basal body-associated FliL family protein n=1 Tax=Clostridium sp. JN-9 TaxID=2507159 RepID=UPI000FFE2E89|nr:flagellar basal body-associated FliL family protein [Clostridium sp. JN-9]QAT39959.1 flagellar basal body protein FliL [Clostridium sp. JN-9]
MSEEKKEKKSGGIKVILIVILIIIAVGGGAFAGYYFYSKSNSSKPKANTLPVQPAANTANVATSVVSQRTYSADDFLVNLADEDGKKYLKVKVYLGYENKKMDKELDAKKPIIRDTINSVLRVKKSTDFTAKGTEDMKREILQKLNPIFTNGQLDNIYFYDIVVQY